MKNIHYGRSAAPASRPTKTRRCSECKNTFLTPEAFRGHKRGVGGCRSVEAMIAIGFTKTEKGWKNPAKVLVDAPRRKS